MKLVINTCYGGFGLSLKGQKRYLELKGKQAYFYKQKSNYTQYEFERIDSIENIDNLFIYCTTHDQGKIINDWPEDTFHARNIERNDPDLVQVVEELGPEASGMCNKLTIVEIESGRWYKIDEYDGLEHIEYRDNDDDWLLAE